MLKSTKNYDMFVLRPDNRESISYEHVNRLARSIKQRNMLDMKPVLCNEKMEILDGQHRFLAAKQVGETVYYSIEENITPLDMLKLQISKQWNYQDYLNYFVKHEYEDYKKLAEFMKKTQLNIRVSLMLLIGRGRSEYEKFKEGTFKFNADMVQDNYTQIWETVDFVRQNNGARPFQNGISFWKALIMLHRHPNFKIESWRKNLEKFVQRIIAKPSQKEFMFMVQEIYNYRQHNKIDLTEFNGIDSDEFVAPSEQRMLFNP